MTKKTFNRLRDILADSPECLTFYFDLSGRVHIDAIAGATTISCITTPKTLALLLSYTTLVVK